MREYFSEYLDAFCASKPKLVGSKVRNDLGKRVFRAEVEPRSMTIVEFVEKRVNDDGGAVMFEKNTWKKEELNPSKKRRIDEAFNSFNPNWTKVKLADLWVETPATLAFLKEKNLREIGRLRIEAKKEVEEHARETKSEYLYSLGNGKCYSISKTEYDYAQFVSEKVKGDEGHV